jgi:type IV pilus assembly protein PilN
LAAGAWQDFDLLRRRREELGIEALTPAAGQGLLWRGGLIAAALVALGALGWLGIFAWVRVLESRELALKGVADQHQQFEARLQAVRQQLGQLTKANQALAAGILSIPSGSLLLADLASLTPGSVQLASVKQEGGQLTLNGSAAQPNGLRAINAFQLGLEQSVLFSSDQVQLVKVQEQQAQPAAASQQVLSFELKATLDQAGTKAQLGRLQALGSPGLLRRLRQLQLEGLLQ